MFRWHRLDKVMGVSKRSKKPTRYTGIPKNVHGSLEWAELTPTEKAFLLDICYEYHGYNNGDLNASLTDLKKKGWKNQGTISKTVKSLMKKGFLLQTRRPKQRRCALYAITWMPINECKKGKHLLGDTTEFINKWKRFSGVNNRQSKPS